MRCEAPQERLHSFNLAAFECDFNFLLFSLQLVIPLTTQDDLDKAVELLDRSVHMKSLKILLVLQMTSQVGGSLKHLEKEASCCFYSC